VPLRRSRNALLALPLAYGAPCIRRKAPVERRGLSPGWARAGPPRMIDYADLTRADTHWRIVHVREISMHGTRAH